MTFQELVKIIAEHEDMKSESTIGDIREQLKITLTVLANMPYAEIAKLLARYAGKDVV